MAEKFWSKERIYHKNEKNCKGRDTIGRVFQDPSKGTCPELTILENMAMAEAKDKHFGLTLEQTESD